MGMACVTTAYTSSRLATRGGGVSLDRNCAPSEERDWQAAPGLRPYQPGSATNLRKVLLPFSVSALIAVGSACSNDQR